MTWNSKGKGWRVGDAFQWPSCERRTPRTYMTDLLAMEGPIKVAKGKLVAAPACPARERNTRDYLSTLLVAGEIADFWLSPEGWVTKLDSAGEWEPFDGTTTATVETHNTHNTQRRNTTMTTTKSATKPRTPRKAVAMKALPEAVEAFIANLIYPPKAEYALRLAEHRFLGKPEPKGTGASYEAKVAARLDRIAAAKVAA